MSIERLIAGLIALALASTLAFLPGCASAQNGPPPALDGTSWRLVSWSHVGVDPSDFEITAEIQGEGVAGKSAVNRYFGPLQHGSDGTFRAGMLGSTMMAGPDAAMEAEQVFMRLLPEGRRFGMVDGQLVVFAEDGTAILTFAPAS